MQNPSSARALLAIGLIGLASTIGLSTWLDLQPAEAHDSVQLVSAPASEAAEPVVEPAPAPDPAAAAAALAAKADACDAEFARILEDQPVEFTRGQAKLTKKGQMTLDNLVVAVRACSAMTVEIGGYTDNTGKRAANVRLSGKRANAVKDYLVEQGLSADLFRAVGFGPDSPVASNQTESGRARNRRIEFRIVRGESG